MSTSQNNILVLVIAVTCLLALLTAFMALTIIVYNKRKRKILLEKELLEKTYQEEILKTQLEIQEQTFKNISQEIHDNIGQALTLAKLNLNTLSPVAEQEKITATKDLVSKAIVDLRDLSRSLNTDYVASMGLHKAIETELAMIDRTGVIQTVFSVQGEPYRLDDQKELILFRMVQEMLNNVIKHSEAKTLKATILYNEDFELLLNDDGKGFDSEAIMGSTYAGLGLRNIANRAKLIGAILQVDSSPGKGTQIRISLPKHVM
jgi:two-component system, NarL family, sensor kinase